MSSCAKLMLTGASIKKFQSDPQAPDLYFEVWARDIFLESMAVIFEMG